MFVRICISTKYKQTQWITRHLPDAEKTRQERRPHQLVHVLFPPLVAYHTHVHDHVGRVGNSVSAMGPGAGP